jgi:single-strand DNA-binding protein
MASFNKVILMGNLTRDPELKTLQSGMRVAKLGLAVSEMWRDKATGEQKEVTCFVDVDVWDKLADLCGQYLAKGRPVLVEGRLRTDEWTDKQSGEKRTKLVVRADAVKFVGPAPPRADGQPAAQAPQPAAPRAAAPQPPPPPAAMPPAAAGGGDDENLPF